MKFLSKLFECDGHSGNGLPANEIQSLWDETTIRMENNGREYPGSVKASIQLSLSEPLLEENRLRLEAFFSRVPRLGYNIDTCSYFPGEYLLKLDDIIPLKVAKYIWIPDLLYTEIFPGYGMDGSGHYFLSELTSKSNWVFFSKGGNKFDASDTGEGYTQNIVIIPR